jgi:hypothetical protein
MPMYSCAMPIRAETTPLACREFGKAGVDADDGFFCLVSDAALPLHRNLEPAVDRALAVEGHRQGAGLHAGAAISFFQASSRTAREGWEIHENTTASLRRAAAYRLSLAHAVRILRPRSSRT